jgi:hypothetical protein
MRETQPLVVAIGLVALSCVDKGVGPKSADVTIRIASMVSAQPSAADALDIDVWYARANGEAVELLAHREGISGASHELSLRVDLRSCLDDPSHAAPQGECPLRLTVVLRDASGTALDSVTTDPVSVRPGLAVTMPPIEVRPGVMVTANVCTGAGGAVFAAYQDGSGPWISMPIVNGLATFRIRSGTGGLTYVVPITGLNSGWSVSSYFATAAELAEFGAGLCTPAVTGTHVLDGNTNGIATDESAQVTVGHLAITGSGSSAIATQANPAFTLQNVGAGVRDIVATLFSAVPEVPGESRVRRLLIQRAINVPAAGPLPVFDFAAAPAPETHALTVGGVVGPAATTSITVMTTNLTRFSLGRHALDGTWAAMPAAIRLPGDSHTLFVTERDSPTAVREVQAITFTPGPLTLALGPALAEPTVSFAAAAPIVSLRVDIPVQPNYPDMAFFSASQPEGDRRRWDVTVTQGVRASPSSWLLQTPDLSTAAGWNPDWGLKTGAQTPWAVGGARAVSGSVASRSADGTILAQAFRTGTITP